MRLKEGYKIRDIAGEKMIVLQGEEGVDLTKVVLLSETAEWLFNSLKGEDFTVDTAARMLVERFGIDQELAAGDTKKWIDSMADTGLIEK